MPIPNCRPTGHRPLHRVATLALMVALAYGLMTALVFEGGAPTLAIDGALAQERATAGSSGPAQNATRTAGWVESVLPDYLVSLRVLNVRLWQWIVLTVLVLIASFAGFLITTFLFRTAASLVARTETTWDDSLLEVMAGPLRAVLAILLFYMGTVPLGLPDSGQEAITVLCKVSAVVAVAWFVLRLTDAIGTFAERRFEVTGQAGAKTLVPMGRRTTKIFVLVIAALSLLQNLGFNIAGLLAGLGIGGIAIAFAAQKSLENLFGGIMVVADRPVRIGDFCRVGDHVGTVEDIGLRSSRIRTLDRTLVTIPNAEFSTIRIENFAVRDRMRLHTVIQVGYDTSADQLRYLLVEIRRMLYAHRKTLKEPCRVRFVNFGAHSLDLEIFVFIDTKDWNEFLAVREDIYLRVKDIVEQSGAYFAYPSQTLYLGRDSGRNMEQSRAAEKTVEEWRETGQLPLPEFPQDRLTEIVDTLEFPPPGSAIRAP